jgi:hypothetical protein
VKIGILGKRDSELMSKPKVKLLTLILSFESGSFSTIQDQGQDTTFLKNATQHSEILRYVGRPMDLPRKFRALFAIRRFQYFMLNYSRIWLVKRLLSFLIDIRFGDKAVRSIPSLFKVSSFPDFEEVSTPGKPGKKLVTRSPEDWSLIGLKTLMAFRYLLDNYDFEYLFRTNTSSFVDIPKLLELLETTPQRNVYGGVVGKVLGDLSFASGAGILLSRDVVERICAQESQWKHGLVDDIALGEIVSNLKNPEVHLLSLKRIDIPSIEIAKSMDQDLIKANYHFRCKSSSATETVQIMKYIHSVKSEKS